jgi:NADH-quinone oxidoreductase subunit L
VSAVTVTDLTHAALWLLVLLPALAGGALALGGAVSRVVDRVAAPVSLTTAVVTVALAGVAAMGRPSVAAPFVAGTDFALQVDALAAVVLPAVAVVALLVLVFATGDIRVSRARFHGLMLIFLAAVALTVTAMTLPVLLLAWELMGATSYALIGFWWWQEDRLAAGLTAFVTTRSADLGMYVAAAAALAGGAGLGLSALPEATSGWRDVAALGLLVAALGKAAQLPFSFWLSKAMAGPSPVSALLHSAAMVAMGGYLLLRVQPLLAATGWAATAAAWVGALTALALGAVAVAQRDLKQLLAASTSAQLGFVVMGAGLAAVGGGAAHLVAHASTKALLFLAAGAWLTALGTKRLAGLEGVARRWPLVGWTATIGALTLAGVAPLSIWATKDGVLAAALEESPALYGVGLTASALSAAYAGRVLAVIWRRVPAAEQGALDAHLDEEERGTRSVNLWEKLPLLVLAAGAAVLGVLALPPFGDTLATALGEEGVAHASVTELALSTAVAVVIVLLLWRLRGRVPEPAWARSWLGLEALADRLVVRPTWWLAHRFARFDDRLLDRGVERAAALTVRLGRRAAVVDDGLVDGAVERLAAGMRRLGDLARHPQTGQLHQYYLQAVAVVAAAVILLVVVR